MPSAAHAIAAMALLVAASYASEAALPGVSASWSWDDVARVPIFSEDKPVIHSPSGLRSIWTSGLSPAAAADTGGRQ